MKTPGESKNALETLPIGERYFHLGEFSNGVDLFTQILEREPHNIHAHLMRALCYESFCDELDMNEDLAAILQMAPKSAEAAFSRGLQLRWESGKGAIQQFTEAIQKKPGFTHAYAFRAWLRLDGGDVQGAIEDETACLAVCPAYAIALLHRADAFSRIGDILRSIQDLETYLEYYPNSIMRERICLQIAGGWFRLASQATLEKKRKKTLWDPFWRTYDLFSTSRVWRDPEDLKS